MKKIIILFIIFQIMLVSVNAQSSAEKTEKLKQANKLIVDKYTAGEFEDASKAAHTALELAIEISGNESLETATSYYNLGETYRARNKFAEAATYLRKSLEIYRLNPTGYESKIAQNLDSLIVVLTVDGKSDEAAKFIGDLIPAAETAFGIESKNLIPYLKTATDFYIFTKNFEKAEPLFARRYIITEKEFGTEGEHLETVNDDFNCYLSRFKPDEVIEKIENYLYLTRKQKQPKTDTVSNKINGGVVKGKALSIPAPEYPLSARRRGARGAINVKVLIDETGKILKAKAICGGDVDLQKAAEDAAMKAKFRPTQLEGKPVKVSGTIRYVYVFN